MPELSINIVPPQRQDELGRTRIALITGGYNRRSETFIVRHANGLRAFVICGNDEGYNSEDSLVSCRVIGDQKFGLRGGLYSRAVASLFRRLGSRRGFAIPRGIQRNLREVLLELKPNVALVEFGSNAIRCAPVLNDLGIPFVVHFHGYDASSALEDAAYRRGIRDVFLSAKAVVGVSHQMCDRLVEVGCPPSSIRHISYGIPIPALDTGHLFQTRELGSVTFLTVGNFVEKKAPHRTLEAFRKLLETKQSCKLKMIGGGPLFERCLAYVRECDLDQSVELLGPQPFETVSECMLTANVFLQHSVTTKSGETEGWPNAIGEASACALPIVSTIHAGIPEQVLDGITGFLVAEHDVDEMAAAMVRLASDASLRNEMGLAARNHLTENFALPTQIEKLHRLLTEVSR